MVKSWINYSEKFTFSLEVVVGNVEKVCRSFGYQT